MNETYNQNNKEKNTQPNPTATTNSTVFPFNILLLVKTAINFEEWWYFKLMELQMRKKVLLILPS